MIRDNYLDISKITTDTNVLKIFKIINRHGGSARFVGGAVRDALTGRHAGNLDLSTDLSPDELAEACEEAGIRTVPIGLKNDTLGIVVNNTLLEISSLKKQTKTEGGHILTEFTDNWEEDASRRDLTINAVYADETGTVFDYYNGIEDLENGIIRFVGDANLQIREDYVRILRFFRFYSLFGLPPIDKKSLQACRSNLSGLYNLPIERIRDELIKIIVTPRAASVFQLMFENEILSHWLADSTNLDCLDFLIRLESKYSFAPDALRRLFILYLPDKILAENIAVRLKFTKHLKETLVRWATNEYSIEELANPQLRKKMIYHFGKEFCNNRLLLKAAEQKQDYAQLGSVLRAINNETVPVFPLSGRDLIRHGISSNAQIGSQLEQLEQLWIDSNFMLNRDELLIKLG